MRDAHLPFNCKNSPQQQTNKLNYRHHMTKEYVPTNIIKISLFLKIGLKHRICRNKFQLVRLKDISSSLLLLRSLNIIVDERSIA